MNVLNHLLYFAEVDKDEWNEFLATLRLDNQDSFYTSTWLYTECYMYRRIKSLFEKTYVFGFRTSYIYLFNNCQDLYICRTYMKDFDYFRKQKENALTSALDTIQFVTQHVSDFIENDANKTNNAELERFFLKMLKVNIYFL